MQLNKGFNESGLDDFGQSRMNRAGTGDKIDTPLTQPRSQDVPMTNDFDRKAIAKSLRTMRAKHGADSDIGHRCSNLIEQLKHYPTLPAENRLIMRKSIAKSVEELAERV